MTKDTLRSTIAANIRIRRTELGMSQSALGEAVELSQAQINRIEKCVCSFPADLFAALGEALHVDPLYFLTPQRSDQKTSAYA